MSTSAVDVNTFEEETAIPEQTSIRQSAAQRRWEAGTPASPDAIQEALHCDQELAEKIAALRVLRVDSKSRKGSRDHLMAAFRQAWSKEVQCLQFLGSGIDLADEDFLGPREHRGPKNVQEAATIHFQEAAHLKSKGKQIILSTGSVLDAVAAHEATGIETIALATARLPFYLAAQIRDRKIRKVLIMGSMVERMEMEMILLHAGVQAQVAWLAATWVQLDMDNQTQDQQKERRSPMDRIVSLAADPLEQALKQQEGAQKDRDGQEEEETETRQFRIPALWTGLLADGKEAVFNQIKTAAVPVLAAPRVDKLERKEEKKLAQASQASRKAIGNVQATGETRVDQRDAIADIDEAGRVLEKELARKMSAGDAAGVKVTTGVGKTHALLAYMLLSQNADDYIYAAPTNDLAQETHQKALQIQEKMLRDGTLRRRKSMVFHTPRNEENCQRMHIIHWLETENRAPYAQACQISDLAKGTPGDCPHAQECQASGYLACLKEETKADIIFTVHQAVSGDSSLLKKVNEAGESIERQIVVDEHIPVAKRLELKLEDLNKNLEVARKILDKGPNYLIKLAKRIEEAGSDPEQAGKDAFRFYQNDWMPLLNRILQDFSRHADPGTDQKPHPIHVSGVWADFYKLYQKRPRWLDQTDHAMLPERPWFPENQQEWKVPKLWMSTLFTALKEDLGAWYFKGRLVMGKENALFNLLLKQGGAHLDATMPELEEQILKNAHGKLIDIKVAQPSLDLIQILDGSKHGKASLKAQVAGKNQTPFHEVQAFLHELRKAIHAYDHGSVAILTHMLIHYLILAALTDEAERDRYIWDRYPDDKRSEYAARFQQWTDNRAGILKDFLASLGLTSLTAEQRREKFGLTLQDIQMMGHWQQDDRGHNRWSDAKAMILWGAPLKTPEEYLIDYHIHHAVMKKHGIEWAEWDGTVAKDQKIRVNGGEHEITCSYPLPTVPDARAFVLGQVNQQIAQGIGRLRGVRRGPENPATVFLYMGDFPVGAVEAGDYHLPTVRYEAKMDSYQTRRSVKEVAALQALAEYPQDVRPAIPAILETARQKALSISQESLLAIGQDYIRILLNAIAAYARKRGMTIQEVASGITTQVARWAQKAPSFETPEKPFYSDPQAWSETCDQDADYRMAVVLLAEIFQKHDPKADEAMRAPPPNPHGNPHFIIDYEKNRRYIRYS